MGWNIEPNKKQIKLRPQPGPGPNHYKPLLIWRVHVNRIEGLKQVAIADHCLMSSAETLMLWEPLELLNFCINLLALNRTVHRGKLRSIGACLMELQSETVDKNEVFLAATWSLSSIEEAQMIFFWMLKRIPSAYSSWQDRKKIQSAGSWRHG